ncbi:hypothetical protein QUF72_05695 [Desulfobacterales bacterium HSG2]|nr:hypothetical protein [Desulfobacterales bacterium HSG2]
MPIDLTGIENKNEFYTHHYLNAILENDLRPVFKIWKAEEKEKGIRPPYAELREVARAYFRLRNRMSRVRKPAGQLEIQHELLERLLPVLGYDFQVRFRELDDAVSLPVIGEVTRQSGAPEMWIIEALDESGGNADPFELSLSPCQSDGWGDGEISLADASMEDIVTRQVFGLSHPPRWVMLVNFSHLLLVDRFKWHQKRMLRFDLSEIFGRRENTTLQVMAALLHRESVCPSDGLSLLDSFDENSHKHAFAVSEDLKYALRKSIELLGNEAVYYLKKTRKKGVFSGDEKLDEAQLTSECLRYMYRLLFLFYIEARPELEYAPLESDAYRSGYSLETLRELEMVRLTTGESRNGSFIHESLQMIFEMIYNGVLPKGIAVQQDIALDAKLIRHIFSMSPLNSHLFDPELTPLLNRVKFRNSVLQEVIRRMSISRPENRREAPGRISYVQLGINQLGAVYEALLSYQGFFAETDLYELKKAGESYNELETAYFVKPDDLEKYAEDERVYNDDGSLKRFPKGRFIYRLAGRDRQKSASYYTPEPLTRCLVKYALRELLKKTTADEILKMTVCEPAVGSAAFLNEAVNQLAEAYLQRKQRETKEIIPHKDYILEKQRVKMYLAANNVFGVDLNSVAVELAEVSLWLNTIHRGARVPWFGMQLVCGNSLVGARRQVFESGLLRRKKKGDSLWLDEVPVRVIPGKKRPKWSVWHFLLPDKGMADYKDRVIRKMAGDEIKSVAEWRKGFAKPFSKSETERLEGLSDAVDRLWERHVKNQRSLRRRTRDSLDIFGHRKRGERRDPFLTKQKDKMFFEEIHSERVRNSSPYRRLRLVMDYWCSFWFWPIENAERLPSREEFLFELGLILEGNLLDTEPAVGEQITLFPDSMPKQQYLDMVDELGFVDVDKLCREHERLGLVRELAERYRFLHWELEFSDIFEDRGGFDLILGNPPWIKVEWKESGVLGDAEPLFVLRKFSASKLAKLREEAIGQFDLRGDYLTAYEEAEGTQNFLNAYQNYPALSGIKANLFKCFLPQAWMIGRKTGVSAFLHPEGIYDDPRGGGFREAVYPRLRGHFQFHNELKLFADVDHHAKFSINIYSNGQNETAFSHIANLYAPQTVYACFEHDGRGNVPGIKDEENKWNIKGHLARIIRVTDEELNLFASLYDTHGTSALQARLPALHSIQLISVLHKFSEHPKKLGDIDDEFYSTQHWNETTSQQDGTIRRKTCFPDMINQWILSGPHFFVGNPCYKTPREKCTKNSDYDILDLTELPDDYLPRTNYVPDCDPDEYLRRTPTVPWDDEKPVTNFIRLVHRGMLSQSGERTLISSVMPKESGHIHGAQSTVFKSTEVLIKATFFSHSLIADFYIKTTGRSNLHYTWENFPLTELNLQETLRIFMLNCLTTHYAEIWNESWNNKFKKDSWAKPDPRLNNSKFSKLTRKWNRNCALRTDYERRQALVEIDVLAAMALNLTLDELRTIYRIQFPVLRQNESDTWYDRNGRIVFTVSKGLPGVGFSRPEWEEIKEKQTGTVERTITDNTLPGGPRERTITYHAPFDKCDREKDYETVWAEFEKRFKKS